MSSAAAAHVRAAMPADISEIVRLASELTDDRGTTISSPSWEEAAAEFLARTLADGTSSAFVAEDPEHVGRLVACGVGVTLHIVPSYWLPTGVVGYLQWFVTEEPWRRQGLGGNILRGLIGWYDERGVQRVQLHTTDDAEALYRAAGFVDTLYPNMWLRVGADG